MSTSVQTSLRRSSDTERRSPQELLEQFGVTVDPIHRTRRQRFAAWRGMVINQVARRVIGDDFTALHMTWGAVNELTTQRSACDRAKTRIALSRPCLPSGLT